MSVDLPAYPDYEAVGNRVLLDQPLPTHWKHLALKRLLQFGNGKDHKNVEVDDGGYPVYGSGGPFARASEYLHDGESVLFGRKGTVDKPLYLKCRFWTVDTMYFTRISSAVCARYIYYAALGIPYSLYSTNTALPSMTQEILGNHKIPAPPLKEQTQIAKFLDYETAKIDALIEKQQQLIALLKEKRQAVISHAVTKGLNPEAPMRDSGVEWLGEVPAHWGVARINKFANKITNGYVGPTRGLFVESGVKYLQSLHIKNNRVVFTPPYYVTPDWSASKEKSILREGDVLIVQTGDIGQSACVPAELAGANCHALIVVATDQAIVNGPYLSWCLNSDYGSHSLRSIQTGALHPHLNCGTVKYLPIPVPPMAEQLQIVERVETERARYENLQSAGEDQISLLQERRTALISAAVTGKIDVRDWKAPESKPESEVA